MQRRRKPAAIKGDDGEQEARHTSSLRALLPISQTPGFRMLSLLLQPFGQSVTQHGNAFHVQKLRGILLEEQIAACGEFLVPIIEKQVNGYPR
jgi:hypothetical protein